VEECGSNLLLRLDILFGRRPSPAPAVLAAPRREASPPTWRRRGPQLSAPAVEDERLSAATGGREALHLHGHRVPAACVVPLQGGRQEELLPHVPDLAELEFSEAEVKRIASSVTFLRLIPHSWPPSFVSQSLRRTNYQFPVIGTCSGS
jgi:hypothetical protein